MGNLSIVKGFDSEGLRPSNEIVIDKDVVAETGYSQLLIGPTTVPNVTVNGNLNIAVSYTHLTLPTKRIV